MNTTSSRKNKAKDITYMIIAYIAIILAWQGLFYLGAYVFDWWKFYSVPSPLGALQGFVSLVTKNAILWPVIKSILRCAGGFAISIVIGVLTGIVMIYSKPINKILNPLVMGLQSLPSICWVPFAILWFGLKESAIIFVVVMGSVCSVITTVNKAYIMIPPMYSKIAGTLGAGRYELFRYVLMPAMLPSLVSGLRQSWSFAWRALMSAEVMSATVGLGYLLETGRDMADINQVGLIIVMIIIIGIVIDKFVFSSIERRILEKRGILA